MLTRDKELELSYIVSERKHRFFSAMFRDIFPKPLFGILSRAHDRLFSSSLVPCPGWEPSP